MNEGSGKINMPFQNDYITESILRSETFLERLAASKRDREGEGGGEETRARQGRAAASAAGGGRAMQGAYVLNNNCGGALCALKTQTREQNERRKRAKREP